MDAVVRIDAGYDEDEQAWLLLQAAALELGKLSQVDRIHLSGYLYDMAARDRRELRSRLVVLMCYILKCQLQPERISRGWVSTIIVQQREVRAVIEQSATLQQFATAELGGVTADALQQALAETGIGDANRLPITPPSGLDRLLGIAYEPVKHPMLPLFRARKVRRRRE